MERYNGFFRVVRTEPTAQDRVMVMGQRNEIGFSLCEADDGKLHAGPISEGTPTSVRIPISCPTNTRLVGLHHTHPGGIAQPSATDIKSARKVGVEVLCIDADGDLACFRVRR